MLVLTAYMPWTEKQKQTWLHNNEEGKSVLDELRREAWGYLNSTRKLKLITFVSRRRHKDGTYARPREVNLLIDQSAVRKPVAYQIKNGEIRPRRRRDALTPDQLAQEVLTFIPWDERTADKLLEVVLERIRKIPLFK